MFLIIYLSIKNSEGRAKLLKELMRLFGRLVTNYDAIKESIFFGFTALDESTKLSDLSFS